MAWAVVALVCLFTFIFGSTIRNAQAAVLAWDPSPDTNVVGYIVYYGGTSGIYTNQTTVGDVTNAAVTGLIQGRTYYLTVAAYAESGLQSDYATEISYDVPTVNLPPTLNSITDASINEDVAQQTVGLTGISSGSVSESQTLTVTATSSNTGLIPNPTVTYTSPNTTGSLSYKPVTNTSGTATITVRVNDGQGQSNLVTQTFVVTVNAVNDAPTLNGLGSLIVSEGAGQQTVNLAGISTGANETQTLTVTATSSNTGLIPNPTVNYTSPNATGTLTFTPVAAANGSATITVTVDDGQGQNNTVTRTFAVTVNPVNNQPTLDALSAAAINEDAGSQTVNLTGITSGAANESQTLAVTATSSNTGLIPTPTITYTSPGTAGTLAYKPATNASGTATITVTVNDGQAQSNTISRTFTVTVSAVNDAPALNALNNLNISEGAGQQTVNLAGITTGAANETQTLTVTATSSDTSVIPDPTITYTSPSATGTLRFTPVASANGTATITVTVNDGQAQNNTVIRTFTVTVSPVNNKPTLNALGNLAIVESSSQQTVNLSGITSGAANENQTLTVTATSSNTGLVPTPAVTYTSPNTTGSLAFTPTANSNGTATITVTVNDGQAQSNTISRTFTVTVSPVNNQPTLGAIGDLSMNEDASQQSVSLTGITSGAANESQTLTVTTASSNTGLIPNPTVTYTSPNTTGTLTFKPLTNASGTATITVTVNDGQALSNTVSQTFTVTVGAVNDTPTLNALSNVALSEGAAQQTVNLVGITSGAANESQTLTVTATSSNPGLIPNPTVTYTSPNTTGALAFTPTASSNGTATITVTVNDGQAQNNTATRTFTVTVSSVNNQPTLDALSNLSINESAGLQTVNLAGISSGAANENQTLTVTATSSSTGLIPTPTITYTSPNSTGTLTFTPVAALSGTATITVTVNDGQAQANTVTRTFTVTVVGVNDAPTLNAINNLNINEDAAQQTVILSGITSGAANELQTLAVTATSSDTALIPNPTVSYTSPNTTGTLTFKPLTNANGTATITVTVNDGQAQSNTISRTFTVNVAAVNDAPKLNAIGNLTVEDNAGQQTVGLVGVSSGAANESQTLTVTATSSNTGAVPTPMVNYTSPNATGTLTFTPTLGSSGVSTVTVTVNDGQATVVRTFTVTVHDHDNTAPIISAISNQTVVAFGMVPPIAFTIDDAETPASNLIVTASSSDSSLLAQSGIAFGGSDSDRTVTLTPAPGASGIADITITVDDGTDIASTTFQLEVQPVNASGQQSAIVVNGSGSVSSVLAGKNSGSKSSGIKNYTVTATPDIGWYFAGWSGLVDSTANPLDIAIAPGRVLVANFMADPFFPAAGNYNGLFYESDQVRVASAGSLSLTVAARGAYSGSLVMASGSYSFSGQLDDDFRGTNVIARSGNTTLTLTFQVNSGNDLVDGTVTDGDWTATLQGDRAVFNATTDTAPYAGLYTFVVPGASNPTIPEGDGYGTILVESNGTASITGTLADGTTIAQSVPVSKNGQCPLFVPLYGGKGCLMSWLTFSNLVDSDLTGDLTWAKLSGAGANYTAGFINETTAIGSLYITPTAPDVLSTTNAVLFFDGADLADSITNEITFNASAQILNWSANSLTFNLKINTGIFTGSVTDPDSGLSKTFGGVILQKSDLGYGFFVSGGVSGHVSLLTTGSVPAASTAATAGTMTTQVIQPISATTVIVPPARLPTIGLRGRKP